VAQYSDKGFVAHNQQRISAMKVLTVLFIMSLLVSCGKEEKSAASCSENMEDLDGRHAYLVIGDSISIGYTHELKNLYPAKQVIHNECNGRNSGYGAANVDRWASHSPTWEVCTFNHGIWDMITYFGVSDADYVANLTYEIDVLTASCNKVLFITTTSIPVNNNPVMATEARALELNTLATNLMTSRGVPVCDLHPLSLTMNAERRNAAEQNDVHYTVAGYATLANAVKTCIDAL
jgi:hypothetical protein